MIIRDLDSCRQTDRLVEDEHDVKGWDSTRMLLKDDGVGFSFHVTRLFAGTENNFHYKNHFESVFIMSGEGTIEDRETGEVHELKPGSLYVLDKHDRHTVRPRTEMEVACCFNPPVTGRETHDADGSYKLVD